MIQVSIYKNEVLTNRGQFSSQEEAEAWIAYHQFENAVIEDISAKLAQEQINQEAQAFLDATDWMVVRALEKGEELSPEFKAERQAARDRIIK